MLPADLRYNVHSVAKNTKIDSKQNDLTQLGRVKVKILVVFSFVFFSLVFAQLVFANNLATDGSKISEIYSQIDQLESQNTQLEVQIAQNSSLTNLQKDAQQQGFQKPANVITP